MTNPSFHFDTGRSVHLGLTPDGLPIRHAFEEREIRALGAALAAGRPLLVRGEPGVGKSQLARAAAVALRREFVHHVVDARTEARDLLWHFDAIGRLAKAQVMGALQGAASPAAAAPGAPSDPLRASTKKVLDLLEKELDVRNFLQPRALWWAFHWESALDQAKRVGASRPAAPDGADAAQGCVVLIDEIDKAEPDIVPNGLLEALGAGQFTPDGLGEPVTIQGPPPLVIITTNEERTLPDAFVRRCLALNLALPRDPQRLREKLIQRGRLHYGDRVAEGVLERAADLLVRDRQEAERRHWRPLPGQAEYLDLVRSAIVEAPNDPARQARLIEWNAEFVLKKHPDAVPNPGAERWTEEGDEEPADE
jgi:MoxR-like ATPase